MTLSRWISSIFRQVPEISILSSEHDRAIKGRKTRSNNRNRYRRSFGERQFEQLEQRTLLVVNLTESSVGNRVSITMDLPSSVPVGAQVVSWNLSWSLGSALSSHEALRTASYQDFEPYTPNSSSNVFTIATYDDSIDEYSEAYSITVTGSVTYVASQSTGTSGPRPVGSSGLTYGTALLTAKTETGKILDNDVVQPVSVVRIDSSGNIKPDNVVQEQGYLEPARFRVSSSPSTRRAKFAWSTLSGTATGVGNQYFDPNRNDQDFLIVSNQTQYVTQTQYFPSGVTTLSIGEINIPVNNDNWLEGNEVFSLNLELMLEPEDPTFFPADRTQATYLNQSSSASTVTIKDDEDIPVVYIPQNIGVMETAGLLNLPVTLSNRSLYPVTVSFATSDGSSIYPATSASDYVATAGTISFSSGETTKAAGVTILNESGLAQHWAPPEDFFVTLSGASGAKLTTEVTTPYYLTNWNGVGTHKSTVTITDEAAFPMPTITAQPFVEGQPSTMTITLDPTPGYAFEFAQTLKYAAYWDFYDQSYWQWAGGIPQGIGCISHYDPPAIAARTLGAGSVTFLPNGTRTFTVPIPALPANGTFDPLRFIKIDFEWVRPTSSYFQYFPNPPSLQANLADDVNAPNFTVQITPAAPDTQLFEANQFLGRDATVTISTDVAFTYDTNAYLNFAGTANAADVKLGNVPWGTPILYPRRSTSLVVESLTAINDGIQEGTESLRFVLQGGYQQNLFSPLSNARDIVDTGNIPVELNYVDVLPEDADYVMDVRNDRVAGEAIGAVGVRFNGNLSLSGTTNGPFYLDGRTVRYNGTQPLVVGQTFTFSVTGSVTSSITGQTISDTEVYSIVITLGNAAPVILSSTNLQVRAGAIAGTHLGQVSATDPDGDRLYYAISSAASVPFSVNPETGELYTTSAITARIGDQYRFDVVVSDRPAGSRRITTTTNAVTVNVVPAATGVDRAPVTVLDRNSVDAGQTIDLDVTQNDGDFEGSPLSGLRIVTQPRVGSAIVVFDSQLQRSVIRYSSASSAFGIHSFLYAVSDSEGNEATGLVTVEVKGTALRKGTITLLSSMLTFPSPLGTPTTTNPAFDPFRMSWGRMIRTLSNQGYDVDVVETFDAQAIEESDILIAPKQIKPGVDRWGVVIYSSQAGALSANYGVTFGSWFSQMQQYALTKAQTSIGNIEPNKEIKVARDGGYITGINDDGNMRLLEEWVSTPHPGITLEGKVKFGGRSMCDYVTTGDLPVVAKTETGPYRAIFIASNPDPKTLDFASITGWLQAATGSSSGVSSAYFPTHQMLTVQEYTANGVVVGTLPAVASGNYVLTTPANSLFSYNAQTRQISVADASLLKAKTRQELRFNVVSNGQVIGQRIVTILVTWQENATINLNAPTLQVSTSALPLFSWSAVSGAASYEIMVDGVSPSQPGIVNAVNLTSTSLQTTVPMKEGSYSGKVRARFANGTYSSWSAPAAFDIVLRTNFLTPPGQVNDSNQLISWTSISGVPKNELRIQNLDTVSETSILLSNSKFEPSFSFVDGLSQVGLADGNYSVAVRATNSSGVPLNNWSTPHLFNLDFTPTLLSPNLIEHTTSPLISWTAIPGADDYELKIYQKNSNGVFDLLTHVTGQTSTTYIHGTALPEAEYRVQVRAVDRHRVPQSVASQWSELRPFTVDVNQSPTVLQYQPTIASLSETPTSQLTTRIELGRFVVVDDLDGTNLVTIDSFTGTPQYFESTPTLISTTVVGNQRQLTYAVFLQAGQTIDRDAPSFLSQISARVRINDTDPLLPADPDAELTVIVPIDDLNDNRPVLSAGQSVQIPETVPAPREFGFVLGSDIDRGGNWNYAWDFTGVIGSDGQSYPGLFSLLNYPTASGFVNNVVALVVVNGTSTFDFENPNAPKSFTLQNVRVFDGVGYSTAVDVSVSIQNENDELPVIGASQIISIPERASDGSPHSTTATFGPITAQDKDLTIGTYNWSITSIVGNDSQNTSFPGLFSIAGSLDATNNPQAFLSVSNPAYLDFDRLMNSDIPNQFILTIQLTDGVAGHTDTKTVVVQLTDVNDEVPIIVSGQTFTVLENSGNGTPVNSGPIVVTDLDVPTTFVGWQISDATGLFRVETNGQIVVNDSSRLDYETLQFLGQNPITVTARVSDGVRYSAWVPVTIQVVDNQEEQEISVSQNGVQITDGTSTALDFGETLIGTTLDKVFKVTNHGNAVLTVFPVQVPAGFEVPSNFSASGENIPAGESRTFTVRLTGASVGDFSGTLQFTNNDSNENPFDFAIKGKVIATSPEILVAYAPLADELQIGATHNFGSAQQGGTPPIVLQQTFFVSNVGTRVLKLKAPSIVAGGSATFAVQANGWTFDANNDYLLDIGKSASFTATFSPSAINPVTSPTSVSAVLTLTNDDSNENPFLLNLTAVVQPAGDVVILDDSSLEYFYGKYPTNSTRVPGNPADRVSQTGAGYNNSYQLLKSTAGTNEQDNYSEWKQNGLTRGLYRVSATWPTRDEQKNAGHPTSALISNATYSISVNGVAQTTAKVNQFGAPNDRSGSGRNWEDLGTVWVADSTQPLSVHLHTQSGTGTVIADAIRIERVDVLPDQITLPAGRIEHRIDVKANDPAMQLNDFNADYHAATDWAVTNVAPSTGNGTLTVDSDGAIRFRPTNPYVASSGSFTYTLTSASLGRTTRPTTVSVSVVVGSTILQDDHFETSHSKPLTFDVTANDFDPLGRSFDGRVNLTSVANGWIDPSDNSVRSTTFYVSPTLINKAGNWSLTFDWGNGPQTANFNFVGDGPIDVPHLKSVIEALTNRPSGTVDVLELISDDDRQSYMKSRTWWRIQFNGELADTAIKSMTPSAGTLVANKRGTITSTGSGTFTFTPDQGTTELPKFMYLHGEYAEQFRYRTADSIQTADVRVLVRNSQTTASVASQIRVNYQDGNRFDATTDRYYQIPIDATDADGDVAQVVVFGGTGSSTDSLNLLSWGDKNVVNGNAVFRVRAHSIDLPNLFEDFDYRLFDGTSYSDILHTRFRSSKVAHAQDARRYSNNLRSGSGSIADPYTWASSVDTSSGANFDELVAPLLYYGEIDTSAPVELKYQVSASTVDTGFSDRSFETRGNVAIDYAGGAIQSGIPLASGLSGASSEMSFQYSSLVDQRRPLIAGSIRRDASAPEITGLTLDLKWFYCKFSTSSNTSLHEVKVYDSNGVAVPFEYSGTVNYSGSGTTDYRFALQSPEIPDIGYFDGVDKPLNGAMHWVLSIHANIGGTVRPWVAQGDAFIAPRDYKDRSDVRHTAPSGPFGGFGQGWSISEIPYLMVFKNTEFTGTFPDGYEKWADDRVLLVSRGTDARMFAPFGATGNAEVTGLKGWRAVSFDSRSSVPEEYGTLHRSPTSQQYKYTAADGTEYYFDAQGLPIFIKPLSGPGMGFNFSGNLLQSIQYGSLQTFGLPGDETYSFSPDTNLGITTFNRDENHFLTGISMPSIDTPRTWTVTGASTGRITGLTLNAAETTPLSFTYTYDPETGHLASVTRGVLGSDGTITSVGYDPVTVLPNSVTLGQGTNASTYVIRTLAESLITVPSSGFLDPTTLKASIVSPGGLKSLGNEVDVNKTVRRDLTYDTAGRLLSEQSFAVPEDDTFSDGTLISGKSFERDGRGNVVHATDALNRVTTTQYDYENTRYLYGPNDTEFKNVPSAGTAPKYQANVVSVFADYLQSTARYNIAGYVLETTDALGRRKRFQRDDKQRVTNVTGPLGYSETFEFGTYFDPDTSGGGVTDVLLKSIDARGLITDYAYDLQRRVVQTLQSAAGLATDLQPIISITYDSFGNPDVTTTSYMDEFFVQQTVSTLDTDYDAIGRLKSSVLRDANTNVLRSGSKTYYTSGLLQSSTDGRGTVTQSVYDSRGWLTSVTEGFGTTLAQTTSSTYFADGSPRSITPAHQKATEYFYSPETRTRWTKQNGIATVGNTLSSQIQEVVADAAGNTKSIRDQLTGAETTMLYDRQNRLISSTRKAVKLSIDAAGADLTTSIVYDAMGNVLRQDSPGLAATVIDYNAFNQPVRSEVLATNGRIDHSMVNAAGDVTAKIERRFTILPDNSVTAADLTTILNYDAMGRLTSAIDPGPEANQANRTTTHAYSQLGLQTITTDRFGITGTVIRDAAGQVVSEINPDGSVVSSLYDAAGSRLEQKHEFPLDENGNADPNGFRRVLFTWDALGRLSTTALAATRTGTSPDDLIVRNAYIVQNSPFGTTGQSQTIQVRRADLNQNTPVTTTYVDAVGKQVRQVLPAVPVAGVQDDVSAVLRTEYGYDPAGHTVDVYQYDPLDRRTQTTLNESGLTLRQRAPVGKVDNTYASGIAQAETSYDSGLRPIRIDNLSDNGVMLKQYDPATGMVSRIQRTSTSQGTNPATGLITTYIFDSAGNVLRQTDPAINVVHWAYDSLGRKTSETTKIDVMTGPGERNGFKDVTRTWSYQGMVTTYKDRNGRITVTTPDPTSNTIVEEWKNSATGPVIHSIETIYDSAGGLLSAAEYDGTIQGGTIKSLVAFDRDQFGRATEETQMAVIFGQAAPVTHLVSQFNSLGLRNQLEVRRDNDGGANGDLNLFNIAYAYDNLGRLSSISRNTSLSTLSLWASSTVPGHLSVSFSYELDGNRSRIRRFGQPDPTTGIDPEGFSAYSYDVDGRLGQLNHYRSEGGRMIAFNSTNYTPEGRLSQTVQRLYGADNDTPQVALSDVSLKYTFGELGQLEKTETLIGGVWNVLRDYLYQNDENRTDPQNATVVGKQNRLLTANEDWPYRMEYDDEGNLIEIRREVLLGVETYNHLKWDHRGRLTEVTAFVAGASEKFEFEYDALNRIIGRKQTDSALLPGQTVSLLSYANDGSVRLLESDLENGGKVSRVFTQGVNGEVLATDEVRSGESPYKVWMFPDSNGNITTVGTADFQGNWKIQHRQFQDFGVVDPNQILGDRNSAPYMMDDVPVIWHGGIRDHFKGVLQHVYQIDGRWFDDQMGRFLTEDPTGYVGGRTNLYLLNGSDPFPGTKYTASLVPGNSGPSPFSAYGAFVFGLSDALAFGHFDDLIRANGAQAVAAQSGYYWAGLGIGIAGSFYAGSWLGNAAGAVNASTRIKSAATAFAVYNVVGDGLGVYDAVSAANNGTFGALDAIGLAGSTAGLLGFASGLSQAVRTTRIVGRVENAGQAARLVSHQPSGSLPVLNRNFDVSDEFLDRIGDSRVCFVADTQVAVAQIPTANYFAGRSTETDNGSGAWVACGLASIFGASVLMGDRKKSSRQLSEWDELEAEGMWWIERDPDLDVSELDFEDVCDELLTGSPGMS